MIKCLGLVKKKKKRKRKKGSQSRSLGAVLIPGFKGKNEVGKKGEITELEIGGRVDKEQLNRLRILSLAK